jgi:hypothetical protein
MFAIPLRPSGGDGPNSITQIELVPRGAEGFVRSCSAEDRKLKRPSGHGQLATTILRWLLSNV